MRLSSDASDLLAAAQMDEVAGRSYRLGSTGGASSTGRSFSSHPRNQVSSACCAPACVGACPQTSSAKGLLHVHKRLLPSNSTEPTSIPPTCPVKRRSFTPATLACFHSMTLIVQFWNQTAGMQKTVGSAGVHRQHRRPALLSMGTMKIPELPFTTTDWSQVASTEHSGETGRASGAPSTLAMCGSGW